MKEYCGVPDLPEILRGTRIDWLRRQGMVGEMIANILQVPMTPEQLIATLMSEPYNLAPTEENLVEITRIINNHEQNLKISFQRDPRCFNIRTILSL